MLSVCSYLPPPPNPEIPTFKKPEQHKFYVQCAKPHRSAEVWVSVELWWTALGLVLEWCQVLEVDNIALGSSRRSGLVP